MSIPARRVLADEERIDWLRLSRNAQVRSITFFALIARFGSAGAGHRRTARLAARAGRAKSAAIPPAGELRREVDHALRLGARHIAACEPDYPEALAAIEDAPPVIAAGRDLSLFERPSVAIVGARNASMNGKRIAARLAADLGETGFVVVSGLARGIDTEAHKAALPHGTVAVVAGGIDIVYPPENTALQARIFAEGCLVTEAPLGTEPMARHFPRRNHHLRHRPRRDRCRGRQAFRLADHRAHGARAGARGFRRSGVAARPARPGRQRPDPRRRDPLTESADDVLRVLSAAPISRRPGLPQQLPLPAADSEPEIEDARRVILEALSPVPVAVDELVRDCQVSLPVVLTILLELELAGRLERQAGQRVSLVP